MMMQLYGTPLSGHTHRVSLFLSILNLPFELLPAPAEVRRSPDFKSINPLQQIPVLRDGNLLLSDSNAILVYLAKRYAPGSAWLPEDPEGAWNVQRWLSIASGDIRFGIARARLITLGFLTASLEEAHQTAHVILHFMDNHLASRTFLACEEMTIADLACYSYVAHAPEGKLPLTDYPNIVQWIRRLEATGGVTQMPWTADFVNRPRV